MRMRLFLLSLILLIPVILGAALDLTLAVIAPFQPGQVFFPAQWLAEQSLAWINPDPVSRSEYLLDLLARRTADLDTAPGAEAQRIGVSLVDQLLTQTLQALRSAPNNDWPALRTRAQAILSNLQTVLAHTRTRGTSPSLMADLRSRVDGLLAELENQALPLSQLGELSTTSAPGAEVNPDIAQAVVSPTQAGETAIDPRIVEFPPGSPGAEHKFFPLTDKHALLDCKSCHASGAYAGTPGQCSACHKADAPANHYLAECGLCHTSGGWKPAHFDHTAVDTTNCATCHTGDKPAGHYNGQCSACHSTAAWKPAYFDHQVAGAVDCLGCHSSALPANHYGGQCSGCHSTTAWIPANFNHAFAQATNCIGCHSGNKPAGHYSAQCSGCHNTQAWKPASFNHALAGATDCIACHGGNRPANHYSGQCSTCHNTNAWKPASFNHSFDMNHGGANGNCAACHPSGGSGYSCTGCHNRQEMDQKHHEVAGYSDRCADCHKNGNGGN